jgi:NAD(P)-dependent dehydrogenase (short-subunit alcohol dehydrogenase family)
VIKKPLLGRNIIISGASQGLGEYCAKEMSKKGANIALISRNEESLNRVLSLCDGAKNNIIMPVDITNPIDCANKINEIISHFNGKVDSVIHSVGGGMGYRDPLIGFDDFIKLFSTNLAGQSLINSLVIPFMKNKNKGNIVHVSSVASREAIASVGYNTVKASINAYVRSLGNELADTGVVITGIIPGAFLANNNAMVRFKNTNPTGFSEYEDRLPRKKVADVSEVYSLIEFLTSDSASMMTGCMVPIDAGEGKAI